MKGFDGLVKSIINNLWGPAVDNSFPEGGYDSVAADEWGNNQRDPITSFPDSLLHGAKSFQSGCMQGFPGWTRAQVAAYQNASPIYCIPMNYDTADADSITNPLDLQVATANWWGSDFRSNKYWWNTAVLQVYGSVYVALNDISNGRADEIWHLFYALNNTRYGKFVLDDYFATHDTTDAPRLEPILRKNHTPDVQMRYCWLNEPNLKLTSFGVWCFDHCMDSLAGEPVMLPIHLSRPNKRWGSPFWTEKEREKAFRVILPHIKGQPDVMKEYYQVFLDNHWLINDPHNPGGDPILNPIATHIPGKENPNKTPQYEGRLPFAPKPVLAGQTPWEGSHTTTDRLYKNPCGQEDLLSSVIPVVAGVFAGIVGVIIMPTTQTKMALGGTLGSAAYFLSKDMYGWEALMRTDQDNPVEASEIISAGIPFTAVLIGFDLGVMPKSLVFPRSELVVGAGAAAAGFLVLEPIIAPTFELSGGIFKWITSPLAFLEQVVGTFTSGCYTYTTAGPCHCNDGKKKGTLSTTIIEEVYGSTGQQKEMRHSCLQKQMVKGKWGENPELIGFCNMSNGQMSNSTACLSAFAWRAEAIDPADKEQGEMMDLIAPCLDPANPVFLPPVNTADKKCRSTHGEYWRFDAKTGTCTDDPARFV